MIGTTLKESQFEDRKIFRVHLFKELPEDQEVIDALNNIIPNLKVRKNGKGSHTKPGLYKQESDNGIILYVIK